jgi:spoIIIJ-associated protein
MESTESIISALLQSCGFSFSKVAQSEIAGQIVFSVETDEDLRMFIGQRGDVIHAIDYLVKKIVEQQMAPAVVSSSTDSAANARLPLFLVDVNDYRVGQIRDLQTKALMMADRARDFKYDVELSPMSAYERLIVHTTLQGATHIKTESRGEGRERRLVIKYDDE